MKECPNCKAKYNDYDQYCFKCNYKLQFIKNSKIVDYNPNSTTIDKPQILKSTNIPKCPTCGSTNVKHISTLNRAVSIGVFGLFSSKIGKNYECLDCKSKW